MRSRGTLVTGLGLATALALAAPAQAWSNAYLAGDDVIGDLALGDGDGDGQREVYAATWDGTMRYSWNGTAWVEAHLGGNHTDSVALGDADRDGAREVYAGESRQGGTDLVRYQKASDGWSRTVITSFGQDDYVTTLSGGDLEGDGHQDLLVTLADGNVHKVFHKNGAWNVVRVAQLQSGYAVSSWVGDGDRDGKPEAYLGTTVGTVVELDPGDGWGKSIVGWFGDDDDRVQGVAVADGDGDGLEEVYATGDAESLLRFGFTGSGWNRNKIATFGASQTDLAFGDGDGDGDKELYATGWDGHVHSVHRASGAWVKTDLGAEEDGGDPQTLVLGDGDNDGTVELYVGDMHNAQHPYGHLHRYDA